VHGASTTALETDLEEGFVGRTWIKVQGLTETTWDEAVSWTSDAYRSAKERGRKLFWYLTGETVEPSSLNKSPLGGPHGGQVRKETQIGRPDGQESSRGVWGSIIGLFGGLRRPGSSGSGVSSDEGQAVSQMFEEGEVHADLVKDDNGNFVWRYILIDMPNSRSRRPTRVFVERDDKVREEEAVMQWY